MLWNKPSKHTIYPWALQHWNITPVGSRVTCIPPPMDTDIDYLILGNVRKITKHLENIGFHSQYSSNYGFDSNFCSLRSGNVNTIVTNSKRFHSKFLLATSVAKELNLIEKYYRVVLFQAILYGNYPSQ